MSRLSRRLIIPLDGTGLRSTGRGVHRPCRCVTAGQWAPPAERSAEIGGRPCLAACAALMGSQPESKYAKAKGMVLPCLPARGLFNPIQVTSRCFLMACNGCIGFDSYGYRCGGWAGRQGKKILKRKKNILPRKSKTSRCRRRRVACNLLRRGFNKAATL